jgi:hypothetical protein
VRAGIEEQALNVKCLLHDKPDPDSAETSPYVKVVDTFEDKTLDFVLVDGHVREYCCRRVLPKIKPGGMLVIDNANWYFDYPTHSPVSRVGKGHANAVWQEVWDSLRSWRRIWTSCGVWDTAIWIKTY